MIREITFYYYVKKSEEAHPRLGGEQHVNIQTYFQRDGQWHFRRVFNSALYLPSFRSFWSRRASWDPRL